MEKFATFMVKMRYVFFAIVVAGAVVSAVFVPKVTVNYNMAEYIPADSPSLIAFQKMEEEFRTGASAQIMVENTTVAEAQALVAGLEAVAGVSSVNFDAQNGFKNGNALFTVFLAGGSYDAGVSETVVAVRTYLEASGCSVCVSGEVADSIYLTDELPAVMAIVMLAACIVILLILFLASSSWLEPLVYALVFGTAILINLGTNALLPSISFVTQAICAIIQLALSLDYSIILMHRYNEEKQKGKDPKKAMISALGITLSPVSASGLTTVAGLAALMFMQFKLGLDIGLVLSKGIVISLLTVFLFMPAVILLFAPLLEKTKHKTLAEKISAISARRAEKKAAAVPQLTPPRKKSGFADLQFKTRFIVPIALVLIIAAGFALQLNTEYSYSLKVGKNADAAVNVESAKIQAEFGIQNPVIILVPKGDYEKEKAIFGYINEEFGTNGEAAVTNGQGMVTTGLYDLYTAEALAQAFALPLNLVEQVYSAMNADGTYYEGAENERYLYDLIDRVHTSGVAKSYGEQKQGEIDAQYAAGAPLVTTITAAEACAMFGIDAATAAYMFGGAEQITILQALGFMSQNQIAAQAGMPEKQAGIDAQYAAGAPLVMTVTAAEACARFGIDAATAALMFGEAEQITLLQALGFMSQSKAAKATGDAVQQEIDGLYAAAQTAKAAFESEHYARLVFNLDAETAGAEAFDAIALLREKIVEFYTESHIVSGSATMYDIMKSFTADTLKINLISFFAVLIVILLMFRSISIPVLLTTLIQGAIFVTMGFNTAFGAPIFFICYLVVLCIQMGATVDYAILLTGRYKEARSENGRRDSIRIAFRAALPTILTSGTILVLAAFIVGLVSSISIISSLGFLLAQGCLISLAMITFALPQVLLLCDKLMQKTSIGFSVKQDDNLNE